jgi:hypothetical protein
VALGNWSPGSAWGDYDGDGLLDLYVTGYVHFDRDNLPIAGTKAVGYASCLYRGATVNCGPRGLKGEPDHLFHNNGDGTFTDVTVKAGVEDKDRYYGFSCDFCGHQRQRQAGPGGGQRLRAQLSLHQQGRWNLRRPELCSGLR